MGCNINDPHKSRKRPLEDWWGNGTRPDLVWTNNDWSLWALRVEEEDKLYIEECPICNGITDSSNGKCYVCDYGLSLAQFELRAPKSRCS